MGLPQQHESITNSTDSVDDYSVIGNSDNNKNEIIKKSTKKKGKLVILLKFVDNKKQHMKRQLSYSLINPKSILNLNGTSLRQLESQIKDLLN